MANKKETKRYTLVEYAGKKEKVLNSKQEYDELVAKLKKSNDKRAHKYFFGNITCEQVGDTFVATVHLYNRLTDTMTISELDKLTTTMTEKELIEKFKDKLVTKPDFTPDINVAYFEDKNKGEKESVHYDRRIKYIPVMYIDDIRYADEKYIKRCIEYHAKKKDTRFFKCLANEFESYRMVFQSVVALRELSNKYDVSSGELYHVAADNLFFHLIVERGKNDHHLLRDEETGAYLISRRRLRDFGMFIKNYEMPENKKRVPTRYNGKSKKQTLCDDGQSLKLKK